MEFKWDPGKRAENLLKHGVDFKYARIVFENISIVMKTVERIMVNRASNPLAC